MFLWTLELPTRRRQRDFNVLFVISVSSLPIVKWGRWVLGFLLGCGVLAAVGWYIFTDHQPYYQGRPLSTWVSFYEKASLHSPTDPEPAEALRQIGPRAIPCLMQWVRYERPAWQYKLLAALKKVPFPLHTYSTNFSRVVENGWRQREGRHTESLWAFGVLGPVARPAARELGWLAVNRPGAVGDRAARALMDMGTNAEPAFPIIINALCSTNDSTSSRAAWFVGSLRIPPQSAVGPLVTALKSPRPYVRLIAVNSLAKLQAGAKPAMPALLEALNDPDTAVRAAAAAALMQIPEYAVPRLIEQLAPTNFWRTSGAITALANFGEQARPAVPTLLRLKQGRPGFEPAVRDALRSIAPELVQGGFSALDDPVRLQKWEALNADLLKKAANH
jgi:hypothetical protein